MLRCNIHLIGADVLGDSAGFCGGYIGFANRIQQRCLSMVYVAHDGDHGRSLDMVFRTIRNFLFGLRFLLKADYVGTESKLGAHFSCGIKVKGLVDRGKIFLSR